MDEGFAMTASSPEAVAPGVLQLRMDDDEIEAVYGDDDDGTEEYGDEEKT